MYVVFVIDYFIRDQFTFFGISKYSCQNFFSVHSSFDGQQYVCNTCHLIHTFSINTLMPCTINRVWLYYQHPIKTTPCRNPATTSQTTPLILAINFQYKRVFTWHRGDFRPGASSLRFPLMAIYLFTWYHHKMSCRHEWPRREFTPVRNLARVSCKHETTARLDVKSVCR